MNFIGVTILCVLAAVIGGFFGFLFGMKRVYDDSVIPTRENADRLRVQNRDLRQELDDIVNGDES